MSLRTKRFSRSGAIVCSLLLLLLRSSNIPSTKTHAFVVPSPVTSTATKRKILLNNASSLPTPKHSHSARRQTFFLYGYLPSTPSSTSSTGVFPSRLVTNGSNGIIELFKQTWSKLSPVLPSSLAALPLAQWTFYAMCLGSLVLLQRKSVPMGRYLYKQYQKRPKWQTWLQTDMEKQYDEAKVKIVAEKFSTAGQLGTYLYGCHIVSQLLYFLAPQRPLLVTPELAWKMAKATFTVWGAWELRQYKKLGLCALLKRDDPERMGKAGIFNTVADILLALLTFLAVTDIMGVSLGSSFTPIFALAGTGVGVFALASQGIAAQLLAGLQLVTANKFEVGEEIQVGVGTNDSISVTGKVEAIGWMETTIRSDDESTTKLPNSVFNQEQMVNLSRNGNSRVIEKLAVSYDSMQQIPKLVKSIKANLIKNCPKLVSDGSRPFIVSWNGYRQGYLEVLVDARFNIPPIGETYFENKQRVMEAIADAIVENKVQFANQQQQMTE